MEKNPLLQGGSVLFVCLFFDFIEFLHPREAQLVDLLLPKIYLP